MSYPTNYPRGNHGKEATNTTKQDVPAGLSNLQPFGPAHQANWQQLEYVPVATQPVLNEQPLNWNNNISQKPAPHSFEMNYKGHENYTRPPAPPQTPYMSNPAEFQHQQFVGQNQYENTNQYSFGNLTNASHQPPYGTRQQMSFQAPNAGASDPWNWGWDESSTNSPAAPYSTNNNASGNWNISDGVPEQPSVFNPVQSYFQPSTNFTDVKHQQDMPYDPSGQFISKLGNQQTHLPHAMDPHHQNFHQNNEKLNFSSDVMNVKPDIGNEVLDSSNTLENANEINFHGGEMYSNFDIKTEGAQSYRSSSLSNPSEIKMEKSSPGSHNSTLTTQALKDFCKEECENGALDLKSRSNAEGLTPQWSVESQVSQETISDDVSPSLREGSHSDLSTWETTPGNQNASDMSQDNLNSFPPLNQTKELNNPMQSYQTHAQGVNNFSSKSNEHLTGDEMNEQVTSRGSLPPPPIALPRNERESGNNPYSLGKKQPSKGNTHKNYYQKQSIGDNLSGNDYENLVKKLDSCSVSNNNVGQHGGPGNSTNIDHNPKKYGVFKPDKRFENQCELIEDIENQETIPDNEERPADAEARKSGTEGAMRPSMKGTKVSRSHQYPPCSENQEVTLCPDRNQYLETGHLELEDQANSIYIGSELVSEPLPPPGLSRHVPGEIHPASGQNSVLDVPPPGLHRMVLGQFNEAEDGTFPDHSSNRISQNTPPPDLRRMVPGQLTDDQGQCSTEESATAVTSNTRRNDIPPPGLRRMIPGESSSPETQSAVQIPDQRVVTGVAKEEININTMPAANISSQSPTPANRLTSQPIKQDESRLQFQTERCETIGSDNVDNYNPNSLDKSSSKLGKRKENKEKERHRGDISSDESDRESSRRHDRDSDYYDNRERNREREDSSGERYNDDRDRRVKGRERGDWERRKDSPGKFREDKGRRRDYRDDRRRHKDYGYSDEDDEDTNGYYSDRERRNVSRYKDDYDRASSRKDDRRSARPEKSPKSGNEERSSGKSRRRGGYGDRDLNRNRDRGRDRDREKDRDRERDRGRKDRDRQSDYYRRKDDTDEYSQRSRPSSRNDSIQDYKHRSNISDYDVDREKDHYRGHSKRDRDMFFSSGFNYNPAYYNYYYQYYENLRRTNPAAYAEWFRKYYAHSQQGTFDGTFTEDRASVHSGRSSANEENKDRCAKNDASFTLGYPCYQSLSSDQIYPCRSQSSDTNELDSGRRLDSSMQIESVQRLTPEKFTTAHVKGSLTPRGQLVQIMAHYPQDGQPATLLIHENLRCFKNLRNELQNFPGPLVKGVTHKNNILRYCKQKIKDVDSNPEVFDKESYKLIWELLMLLIRQNGTVVGTDIAELLMCNRSSHVSCQQAAQGSSSDLSEEEITNQFRDYLIYGNTKEALEWAMKNELWGHALFLASKMDQRTYASVMTRFANGLTMNDPLQTLYQLMSGRQPASVTCCADEKWGDWRPHLAMILSNSTARPDVDVKAVTTLGDTLGSRGNLHAAHFCYLMAQVEFGTYSHKSSKIVLIGSSHTLPFQQFANNEAIFATEIFEFACSLADPDFALHHLQVYKLLMAKRLTEVGLLQEAVHYVEVIANTIAKFPAHYPPYFIQEVHNLGNLLKYHDPVYNSSEGNISDPEWLLRLLNILNDYQMGILQHDGFGGSVSNLTTYSENDGVQNLPLDTTAQEPISEPQSWQNQQQQVYYDDTLQHQQQLHQQQQQKPHWNLSDPSNSTFTLQNNSAGYLATEQPGSAPSSAENTNVQYWSNQSQWMQPQKGVNEGSNLNKANENQFLTGGGVDAIDSNQSQSPYNYYDANRKEQGMLDHPISGTGPMPASTPKQRTLSQSSGDLKIAETKPRSSKKESSKHNQTTGSWFGGIWNKLPFRPKNQMILPDDKNPSIVWDPDKNRWVNLNADEDNASCAVAPPPKASDLVPDNIPKQTASVNALSTGSNAMRGSENSDQVEAPSGPGLPQSAPNKYKMTRGKSLRSNYVDVFNSGGSKPSGQMVAPSDLFPPMTYSSQLPNNYFIPAPVEGNENASTDFLSVSSPQVPNRCDDTVESLPQQQALSRWSSTSSLSREVQKYTMKRAGKPNGRTQGSNYVSDNNYNGGQWPSGPGGPGIQMHPGSHSSSFPRPQKYAQ